MPKHKNAEYRFLVLDKCFSNFHQKYTIDDLLEQVNDKLYDVNGSKSMIMERQLRGDINAIRKMLPEGVFLEAIPYEGKKCYYRYSEKDFSIYNNELSVSEVQNLRSTIEMLSKYRSLPANAWIEEVISNLEIRFGVKNNSENLVSFEQNEQLKGLEYLSDLIDVTINHQPIEIEYISANNNYYKHIIHPYFIKQYNSRWYLFGFDEKEERIKNLAFDRIESISQCNHVFRKNDIIDFNSYFDNVVGVTVPNQKDRELLEIQLKFTPNRFRYVISKPIHKSQRVIDEEKCIVSLKLYPTLELEQQILSFGSDVEVLTPQSFRDKIVKKIEDCLKKYFPMQNLCIAE